MRIRESFGSILVLTLSLAALMGMGGTKESRQKQALLDQAYPPDQLQDATYKDGSFSRKRVGDSWSVTYRFRGLVKVHEVSCKIGIAESKALITKFSYNNDDRATAVAKYMTVTVERETKGQFPHLLVTVSGKVSKEGKFSYSPAWKWNEESFLVLDDRKIAKKEVGQYYTWFETNKKRVRLDAESSFLRPRGFTYDIQQGWFIDYSQLVESAAKVLAGCSQAFNEEVGDRPEILMKFLQVMPFKAILDENTDWGTGGVRVPASVLLQDEGDCDSKAATFCVLERKYPRRLILFKSYRREGDRRPGHVLLGVQSFPSAGPQKWNGTRGAQTLTLEAGLYRDGVRIDNVDYDVCEVASPNPEYGVVAKRLDGTVIDTYSVIPIQPLQEFIAHKGSG